MSVTGREEEAIFRVVIADKHLQLAQFATRTQFGRSLDTLLATYLALYNVPFVMEEIKKLGRACALV